MGIVNIRIALETALNNMVPALSTAFENVAFTPPASTVPYQQCTILFAKPSNREYGSRHTELGYMQVDLLYPLQAGSLAAETRAELVRSTFYRGATFISGGVTVSIDETPEISPGSVEGDRWRKQVKIRFSAQI